MIQALLVTEFGQRSVKALVDTGCAIPLVFIPGIYTEAQLQESSWPVKCTAANGDLLAGGTHGLKVQLKLPVVQRHAESLQERPVICVLTDAVWAYEAGIQGTDLIIGYPFQKGFGISVNPHQDFLWTEFPVLESESTGKTVTQKTSENSCLTYLQNPCLSTVTTEVDPSGMFSKADCECDHSSEKQGLKKIVGEVWTDAELTQEFQTEHSSWKQLQYSPRKKNREGVELHPSWIVESYTVTAEWVQRIVQFADLVPTVDAFASTGNHRMPRYWTSEDDAFLQDWGSEILWMNPLFQ